MERLIPTAAEKNFAIVVGTLTHIPTRHTNNGENTKLLLVCLHTPHINNGEKIIKSVMEYG